MRLAASLFKGLTESEKSALEKQLLGNKTLFRQFRMVLMEKLLNSYVDEEKESIVIEDIYRTIGYRKAIREVVNLLPKDEQNDSGN